MVKKPIDSQRMVGWRLRDGHHHHKPYWSWDFPLLRFHNDFCVSSILLLHFQKVQTPIIKL